MVKPQHKFCPPYQGANDSDEGAEALLCSDNPDINFFVTEVKKSGDSDEAMEGMETLLRSDNPNIDFFVRGRKIP